MTTRAFDTRFEGSVEGTCDGDGCDFTYDVASRTDHCTECGTCMEHCVDPKGHGEILVAALIEEGFGEDDARMMVESDDWMATPEQLREDGR